MFYSYSTAIYIRTHLELILCVVWDRGSHIRLVLQITNCLDTIYQNPIPSPCLVCHARSLINPVLWGGAGEVWSWLTSLPSLLCYIVNLTLSEPILQIPPLARLYGNSWYLKRSAKPLTSSKLPGISRPVLSYRHLRIESLKWGSFLLLRTL